MNQSIKKILNFPITKIILGISACFSIFVGIQNFISKPLFYSLIQDRDHADPLIHIISLFILLLSYYFMFRLYDKRAIKELSTKYLAKEMFGGFSVGFLTISLSVFILYLLGHYQFIEISTTNYPLKLFTLLMVAALIEDLFIRGLILRELENWLGTHIALVIIMVIETSHFFNPNSNLFSLFTDLCWGFTMSMLFIYTKRIWLPFFFHLGWNFAQPFYGSNLTGLDNMGTIIQSKFQGPILLTGGAVGIENSIITVLFLLSIGLFLYYRAYKEGKIIKRKTSKL
ncbi:membrane protease YdiL (CAAX protease family) [Flavobacterium arsenatis]|uniref:Membrane protease YdiL (CAAX protease family) n=1 Tax=Flavobacterium arsenatis TaxID=1484332 RepID=A0ABU1TK57_9FLAO|nr:type II CAAX endopeptidase family protein [Flavobacterium arsenatis]MDR6966177.1 membrane protease YdiL (CAAX protease family) [Flavobacterium arsenatis]